ncbi:hypothetical protein EVAR_85694_1 [Eumeta japonica]|uniref:Uncharacterized protein n=1 Tax=Eumeta variegata TaxID=151549 RepID=A0A4C1WC76_EUMVA|nr:hypothetical protein EVAR_85694_1 [Eumeta japonica]
MRSRKEFPRKELQVSSWTQVTAAQGGRAAHARAPGGRRASWAVCGGCAASNARALAMARWSAALVAVLVLTGAAARKSPPSTRTEPQIEEVTAKQLERVLEEKDFVAVYWCKASARPAKWVTAELTAPGTSHLHWPLRRRTPLRPPRYATFGDNKTRARVDAVAPPKMVAGFVSRGGRAERQGRAHGRPLRAARPKRRPPTSSHDR